MECGDDELVSFGLKVNQAALCVDRSAGVACSHFRLVLGIHCLSDGWVRCIKAWYGHSKGSVIFGETSCLSEIEEQR